MRILIELTYYRPHTSGLTIYAERLAKAFVNRGHYVTVLTSQYRRDLSLNETQSGVHVIRVPVLARISKGVIMPSLGKTANALIREHDVLHLHLPQFDAAGLALRGRLYKKPTIITYHCDLQMPKGFLSWLANQSVRVMNNLAAIFTHRIVTYTQDYADHSRFLTRWKRKLAIILPPVELPVCSTSEICNFQELNNPQNIHPIIGIAARFATEKGVEILLIALKDVIMHYPKAQVWFAGPFENIYGEEAYFEKLKPLVDYYVQSNNWKFLGELSPHQMAAFYPNLDVLVIPSLNSTEAFGLVQIEAMMNGVSVVASDLPGVRQPIMTHKMGKVIRVGDASALAEAIISLCNEKSSDLAINKKSYEKYQPDQVAREYERLFNEIVTEIGNKF